MNILSSHNWVVCFITAFDALVQDCTIGTKVNICLSNHLLLLLFCAHIDASGRGEVYNAILHFAVRCLYEAKTIDSCIDAER